MPVRPVDLLAARASATVLATPGQTNRVRAALHRLARHLANAPDNIHTALQGLAEHTKEGHWF